MPLRNDISKIPIIGSGLFIAALLVFLSGTVLACSIFPPMIDVAHDFDVLVMDNGKPVAGIPIQVTKIGVEDGTPLLTLKSDKNGRITIRGLKSGEYSVDSKGAIWVPGFVARIGNPKAKNLKKVVEFHWPFNQIVQTKSLQGRLWSANPHQPFEDLEVKALLIDGSVVAGSQFTGRSGQFDFSSLGPGLYVLQMHAKQPAVQKNWEAEGGIVVEVAPGAETASQSLDLSIGMSSCGISYAQCAPAAPITLTSREMRVMDPLGAAVGSAEYILSDGSGSQVAMGKTEDSGVALLPGGLAGSYKLSIFRLGFTPLEQALDFAPAELKAPSLRVTLNLQGTCSIASLEKHATKK